MLRKVFFMTGLFLILATLAACSGGEKITSAEEVIQALKDEGLPVGEVKVYTESDDPNELMGRPGGYIAKADFLDTGVLEKQIQEEVNDYNADEEEVKKQILEEFGVSHGGSVEVFENEDAATKRYDYVTAVSSGIAVFAEYGFLEGNAYLRLSSTLTPDEAEKYEQVLKEIVE